MKRLLLVEPVVALYILANLAVSVLIQQYIYRRIWERETSSSYIDKNSSHCYQNHSDPEYMKQQVVQGISSHFFMYMSLAQFVPGLIVTFILGAYSDRYGRRLTLLLPSIGSFFASLAFLAMSYFSWSIYVIFIPVTLNACFGSFTTLFGGAFAYVADISSSKQKNMRMALLDMIVGVMGGIAVLSSGYLLKAAGFNWPFLTVSLINFANIVYIIFFLEESVQVSRNEQDQISGYGNIREILSGILIIYTSSDFRKRVQIGLLLLAFSTFVLAEFGGAGLFILYELNTPLCWNEILIGYGSAAGLVTFLTSFLGVTLFSHYLRDIFIVLIGILSFVGGMVMAIFATTTLLIFLVRLVSLFAVMPLPVLRSMMSKSILPKDQVVLQSWVISGLPSRLEEEQQGRQESRSSSQKYSGSSGSTSQTSNISGASTSQSMLSPSMVGVDIESTCRSADQVNCSCASSEHALRTNRFAIFNVSSEQSPTHFTNIRQLEVQPPSRTGKIPSNLDCLPGGGAHQSPLTNSIIQLCIGKDRLTPDGKSPSQVH